MVCSGKARHKQADDLVAHQPVDHGIVPDQHSGDGPVELLDQSFEVGRGDRLRQAGRAMQAGWPQFRLP